MFHYKSGKRAWLACLLGALAMAVIAAVTNYFILLPLFESFLPLDALIAFFTEFIPFIRTKLTMAYNLPARYILHTVGPIVWGGVTRRNRQELVSCYRSCLEVAAEHQPETVGFAVSPPGSSIFSTKKLLRSP